MTQSPPAPEPTEAGVATRRRILQAAAETLSAQGYAKTHLGDIARSAGLRPPAVYYYFASREELIAAVMREGQQIVREHVTAQLADLPDDASVQDRVRVAVGAHLRVELELSDFASAVVRNAGQLPPQVRAVFDHESRAFHDLWRGLLDRAEREGVLRPGISPSVGRLLVVGALNWATEWWRPSIPVDRVVDTAQVMVVSGLFSGPGDDVEPRPDLTARQTEGPPEPLPKRSAPPGRSPSP